VLYTSTINLITSGKKIPEAYGVLQAGRQAVLSWRCIRLLSASLASSSAPPHTDDHDYRAFACMLACLLEILERLVGSLAFFMAYMEYFYAWCVVSYKMREECESSHFAFYLGQKLLYFLGKKILIFIRRELRDDVAVYCLPKKLAGTISNAQYRNQTQNKLLADNTWYLEISDKWKS
jgi:hypothetical protein